MNGINHVVVFGGRNSDGLLGDTWVVKIIGIHDVAEKITTSISSPSPRWGHGASVFNNTMYMFGGASNDDDNAVWTFTLASSSDGQWQRLEVQGSRPANRLCFYMSITNMAPWGPSLVIAGGWNTSHNGDPFSDTWVLLPGSPWTWAEKGVAPRAAAGVAATMFYDDTAHTSIMVWGIAYSENTTLTPASYPVGFTTVYVLAGNGTWMPSSEVDPLCSVRLPSANVGASVGVVGGILYVFGGFDTLVGTISQTFYRVLLFSNSKMGVYDGWERGV